MTDREAFLRLQRLYPGRTFLVQRSHWHNEGIGNRIEYRVTLFDENAKDCEGYDGKTLDECLRKVAEAEENKLKPATKVEEEKSGQQYSDQR